jgi:hypothetical protein
MTCHQVVLRTSCEDQTVRQSTSDSSFTTAKGIRSHASRRHRTRQHEVRLDGIVILNGRPHSPHAARGQKSSAIMSSDPSTLPTNAVASSSRVRLDSSPIDPPLSPQEIEQGLPADSAEHYVAFSELVDKALRQEYDRLRILTHETLVAPSARGSSCTQPC